MKETIDDQIVTPTQLGFNLQPYDSFKLVYWGSFLSLIQSIYQCNIFEIHVISNIAAIALNAIKPRRLDSIWKHYLPDLKFWDWIS